MSFELRESVFRYLTEPEVETGVDALTDQGLKKLPSSLDWGEIPKFYRALLAANQVKIEWAISHEELWRVIWSEPLTGWQSLSPDDQQDLDEEAAVTVENCWSESWFGRAFRKPKRAETLWASVSIQRQGLSVGLAIFRKSTPLVRSMDGFEYDAKAKSVWTNAGDVRIERQPDLQPLRAKATAAISQIEELLANI